MGACALKRLDAASCALLLLWVGAALGVLLVPAAGEAALVARHRLDLLAWVAFAGSGACAWLPRWLTEVVDAEPIGALRLWSAALLAALFMNLSSSLVVMPRLEASGADAPMAARTGGFDRQLRVLRVLLALGLATGVAFLPSGRRAPQA